VRCSVPVEDGAGRHVAGAGVTGDAKRLWVWEKMAWRKRLWWLG
jgi:hypothetical protein